MRKVLVKLYVNGEYKHFEALFHQFGQETYEGDTYPCAIVELPEGEVKVVHAEHVQFLAEVKQFTAKSLEYSAKAEVEKFKEDLRKTVTKSEGA